jgi:hypothetical protein
MSDEQQLDDSDFGIRGTEKAAGFTKMPLADAPPQEDLALDASVENFVASRDDPAPAVERAFFDVQTGEPRPSNETVSAEDAARNVANVREAERQAVEEQQNRDLQEALDQLRAPEPQPVAVDEQVTGRTEARPDYTPQPDHPEAVQMDPQIDPEIAAAFQNPKIRAVLEQASQGVEQTKAQFQQATAALALEAQGMITALFPELAGLNGQQMQGALAVMAQNQPERVQQLQQLMGRAQNLVGAYQQQQAQAAQQQSELARAQFQQFAAWHDGKSLVNETPESRKAIQSVILEDAKRAGISEKEIASVYNSVPAFRHSFVQELLADGAKYRLAQRNVATKAHHQVPHVARPGSSAEALTRTEEALASARSKLKPSMSAKEAAAYVIARRAASR